MRMIALCLLLAGCASQPANPIRAASSTMVTVSFIDISMSEALATAERHCGQHGKRAELIQQKDFLLHYRCA